MGARIGLDGREERVERLHDVRAFEELREALGARSAGLGREAGVVGLEGIRRVDDDLAGRLPVELRRDLLGCQVDVVSRGGVSPHLSPFILTEAVPL